MPQFSKRSNGTPKNSGDHKKTTKKTAKSPASRKGHKSAGSSKSSDAPSPIASSQAQAQTQKEKAGSPVARQNQKGDLVADPKISPCRTDQVPEDVGGGFVATSTPVSEHSQDLSPQDLSPQNVEIVEANVSGKKETMPKEVNLTAKDGMNEGNTSESQTQMPSHIVEPAPGPTEATPLLQGTDLENWAGVGLGVNERTRGFRDRLSDVFHNRTMWRSLLLFVIFLGIVAILVFQIDFQKLANDAIQTDVKNVSLLGIHDNGVEFQVSATMETNYDNVNNTFLRYMARTGGHVAGAVLITPKNNCSVYFSTDTLRDIHLMDVFPPEIAVDLADHRVSDVDFTGNAVFTEAGAGQLLKTILRHGFGNPLTLNIEVRLAPKISGKWFGIQLTDASIFHVLEIPPLTKSWHHEIQDFSVVAENNHTQVRLSTGVPPLPVKMSLERVEWNIAFPDCNLRPVVVGNGTTSGFKVDPSLASTVSFSGTIDKIPPELLGECTDGLTPANGAIRQIVNDKILSVFVSAKDNVFNRQALPSWLFKILSSDFLYISIPFSVQAGTFQMGTFSDFAISSSNLQLTTNNSGDLEVLVAANAFVGFNLSSAAIDFDVAASNLSSTVSVFQSDETIFVAQVPGTGDMYLTNKSPTEKRLFLDYHNVSVEIIDPSVTGKYINSILIGSHLALPDWSVEVKEVVVESPLMSGMVKDLKLESKRAKEQELTSPRSSKFVEWILENSQISTDKIFLVSSSPKTVEFVVDFQVTNPLNITVGIANDELSFDLKYNETGIGIASIENFEIPNSRERLPLTARLFLFYDSEQQRVLAEEFMSRVMSGSTDLKLGISGSEMRHGKAETGLSKLLKEIRINEISVPSLNFTIPEELQSKSPNTVMKEPVVLDKSHINVASESRQSPFLIDATFYMWSSEIELTVLNPLANVELEVRIIDCLASYKGESLAHIDWSEILVIPSGIYVTPRIPIKIASGIGADILRKAMNGGLAMDVVAQLSVLVDQFPAELMYRGTGLTAKVKL